MPAIYQPIAQTSTKDLILDWKGLAELRDQKAFQNAQLRQQASIQSAKLQQEMDVSDQQTALQMQKMSMDTANQQRAMDVESKKLLLAEQANALDTQVKNQQLELGRLELNAKQQEVTSLYSDKAKAIGFFAGATDLKSAHNKTDAAIIGNDLFGAMRGLDDYSTRYDETAREHNSLAAQLKTKGVSGIPEPLQSPDVFSAKLDKTFGTFQTSIPMPQEVKTIVGDESGTGMKGGTTTTSQGFVTWTASQLLQKQKNGTTLEKAEANRLLLEKSGTQGDKDYVIQKIVASNTPESIAKMNLAAIGGAKLDIPDTDYLSKLQAAVANPSMATADLKNLVENKQYYAKDEKGNDIKSKPLYKEQDAFFEKNKNWNPSTLNAARSILAGRSAQSTPEQIAANKPAGGVITEISGSEIGVKPEVIASYRDDFMKMDEVTKTTTKAATLDAAMKHLKAGSIGAAAVQLQALAAVDPQYKPYAERITKRAKADQEDAKAVQDLYNIEVKARDRIVKSVAGAAVGLATMGTGAAAAGILGAGKLATTVAIGADVGLGLAGTQIGIKGENLDAYAIAAAPVMLQNVAKLSALKGIPVGLSNVIKNAGAKIKSGSSDFGSASKKTFDWIRSHKSQWLKTEKDLFSKDWSKMTVKEKDLFQKMAGEGSEGYKKLSGQWTDQAIEQRIANIHEILNASGVNPL